MNIERMHRPGVLVTGKYSIIWTLALMGGVYWKVCYYTFLPLSRQAE